MSQISPPIRILLVCAVAFLAAWTLFLRPKDDVAIEPATAPNTQTSAPAESAPGKAVEQAQNAVAAEDGHGKAVDEATGGQAAGTASAAGTAANVTGTTTAKADAAAAALKADLAGLPKPVQKAVAQHKTLVLLFWNRKSADDRAVRHALRGVDTWGGRVFVAAAPLSHISKWGRIARGVDVEQSPTVVIVDRKLQARTLVGYTDTATIDQAVVDAVRNSGRLIADPYLRKVDATCTTYANQIVAIPDASNTTQNDRVAESAARVLARFKARFAAIPAPAKWRSFKHASVADLAAMADMWSGVAAGLGRNPGGARTTAVLASFEQRGRAVSTRFERRMDQQHVLGCGSLG